MQTQCLYLTICKKLLFALGGKGLRGIQTNDENPRIFWELNKVQAMSRFDTFKGFIWTFRQASLTFSIWSFPAQYINTNDQFHNPIPTSPGLANFGVTSSSGFEVSSFRNLSKTTTTKLGEQCNPHKTLFWERMSSRKLLLQNSWLGQIGEKPPVTSNMQRACKTSYADVLMACHNVLFPSCMPSLQGICTGG